MDRAQGKKVVPKKGAKNNKPHDKRKCLYCGTPGHLSKDCRKKKKTGCFHCGEAGHLIKDCPKKGQRAGSTSGG